ncbi:phage PhiH1 repressor-like protein [Natrinema altunense JCM 12890]|uniref:Phage PhiH1 repressor-like protein n=1 Tax=Natrinema altunense (strain JCM 12890 / CGMCC 1.3731 / AJ2) TaxID=1227494 RepID=L9ZDD4_NATA2|nr:phage PhiH1 repressor-like protein [Natrinema altunense JCM 12890]
MQARSHRQLLDEISIRIRTGQRCRTLADHGLLERKSDGYYSLTELGARDLDEDIDAGELDTDH